MLVSSVPFHTILSIGPDRTLHRYDVSCKLSELPSIRRAFSFPNKNFDKGQGTSIVKMISIYKPVVKTFPKPEFVKRLTTDQTLLRPSSISRSCPRTALPVRDRKHIGVTSPDALTLEKGNSSFQEIHFTRYG